MENTNYYLRDQDDSRSEWDRLDELHQGIKMHLGGKLSFAPLGHPSKILDLGAGSGAWTIQAAQNYPEASVLAVDIAPLPPRPFPSNVSYHKLNLLDPIPLQQESFDVVHVRLVLFHLPNARSVLEQALRLLKPEGWLLVEDVGSWTGHSGPAQITFHESFISLLSRKGLDENLGGHLETMLRETVTFSEINVRKVQLAITYDHELAGTPPDLLPFSRAMTSSLVRIVTGDVGRDFKDAGLTPELQIAWKSETEDSQHITWQSFYFTWSRKCAGS